MTAYMDHKDLANETIDAARAQEITDNVHRVLDSVAKAESDAGRDGGSVRLLAATKTRAARVLVGCGRGSPCHA